MTDDNEIDVFGPPRVGWPIFIVLVLAVGTGYAVPKLVHSAHESRAELVCQHADARDRITLDCARPQEVVMLRFVFDGIPKRVCVGRGSRIVACPAAQVAVRK